MFAISCAFPPSCLQVLIVNNMILVQEAKVNVMPNNEYKDNHLEKEQREKNTMKEMPLSCKAPNLYWSKL